MNFINYNLISCDVPKNIMIPYGYTSSDDQEDQADSAESVNND